MKVKDKNWCLRNHIEIELVDMECDSTGSLLFRVLYFGKPIGDYWGYNDNLGIFKRRWIKRLINKSIQNDMTRMGL